jgi:hypothetical protein
VALNAAGIAYLQSAIGATAKLCLRDYTRDYLNAEPDGEFWAQINMAESGGATRPNLVITYV